MYLEEWMFSGGNFRAVKLMSHNKDNNSSKNSENCGRSNDMCVFTPTYNRAYCLSSLFASLCRQTVSNFNWLIVDDGSTDETEELIERFMEVSFFPITYIKQQNGGKQRAHNCGVNASNSELFICVDSDDKLVDSALQEVWNCWQKNKSNNKVAGIIALQGSAEGVPHGTKMPEGLKLTTMWDLYYKYKHKGDTVHIYRTDILKKYPFEVEEGEKFIAETYVYHQIDQKYLLAVLPSVIYVSEYLNDGYTKNVRKVTRENPRGYSKLKRLFITYSHTPDLIIKNTILYMVGCMLASDVSRGIKEAPYRWLAILVMPLSYVLCKTIYRKHI